MNWLHEFSMWATGNGKYHTLYHCMGQDKPWVAITVTLCLAVAAGYVLIAIHWWKNEKTLPASPARTALGTMRNIFAFCGLCGYVFIPIKMVWPAWRLYDFFLAVLVYYTWRYALGAKNLRVIYSAISRSNQLASDLAESREESKRKSFFLNSISHDLRTPLNGLMLQANLAEVQAVSGNADGVRAALDEIKSVARLTADLLDGLLEFARLENADERPSPEKFELDALLQDVLNTHAAAADSKSLQLSGSTNTRLVVCTDRLKLERILNNLISNAIKFTSDGSVVLRVDQAGDGVEINVVDTGIGIAPADQERLFEEFFQVHNLERNRQKGFGLGLAICQRLVHQLGGELRVQSTVGRGSRFTVVLPHLLSTRRDGASVSSDQPAPAAPTIPAASPRPVGGG